MYTGISFLKNIGVAPIVGRPKTHRTVPRPPTKTRAHFHCTPTRYTVALCAGLSDRGRTIQARHPLMFTKDPMTDLPNLIPVIPLALGSSVLGGLITAGIAGLRDSAGKRREGYSLATRALVARAEYPYRVRRRTSDSSETLSALSQLGSDIQEQLVAARIWVSIESPRLGKIYLHTITELDATIFPATQDAWSLPPIACGNQMNLNGWGPGNQHEHIAAFEHAVQWRFGLRRLIPFTP